MEKQSPALLLGVSRLGFEKNRYREEVGEMRETMGYVKGEK